MPPRDDPPARQPRAGAGAARRDPAAADPSAPADVGAATAAVAAWVGAVLPGTAVAIGPEGDGPVLCLLHSLEPVAPRHGDEAEARPPLTLSARYAIAARGRDAAAHDLIGRLAFARLEGLPLLPPGSGDEPPPPPRWWRGHGLPPLPALGLRVPVVRRRGDPPPGIVREPLIVRHVGVARWSGRLLSAAGEPIAGALVAAQGAPGQVRTGDDGRFTLGIAADRPPGRLSVTLRRRTVAIDPPAGAVAGPVVLTIPD